MTAGGDLTARRMGQRMAVIPSAAAGPAGQPVSSGLPRNPIDWDAYRKCRVCLAATGEPCLWRTDVPRDTPHAGRELRSRRDA